MMWGEVVHHKIRAIILALISLLFYFFSFLRLEDQFTVFLRIISPLLVRFSIFVVRGKFFRSAFFRDNLQACLLTVCCSMLSWESGCNLVVSIASFIICVISKQRSFSCSDGTAQGRNFTGSHSFIGKDVREFRSGHKGRRPRVGKWWLCNNNFSYV